MGAIETARERSALEKAEREFLAKEEARHQKVIQQK